MQVIQRVEKGAVHVKEHGADPLFFVVHRPMRQQDTAHNEGDAHIAQRRHPLPEENSPENGGKGGTQGAEKAGPAGTDAALGHRLQRVSKAGAYHRQRRNYAPFVAGLGQAGRFEYKRGHEGKQAQKAHLQHTQGEAVRPVAGAVDGDDAHGVQKGRQNGNALARAQMKAAALQR